MMILSQNIPLKNKISNRRIYPSLGKPALKPVSPLATRVQRKLKAQAPQLPPQFAGGAARAAGAAGGVYAGVKAVLEPLPEKGEWNPPYCVGTSNGSWVGRRLKNADGSSDPDGITKRSFTTRRSDDRSNSSSLSICNLR
jgi:hypothetical protein